MKYIIIKNSVSFFISFKTCKNISIFYCDLMTLIRSGLIKSRSLIQISKNTINYRSFSDNSDSNYKYFYK